LERVGRDRRLEVSEPFTSKTKVVLRLFRPGLCRDEQSQMGQLSLLTMLAIRMAVLILILCLWR
jgi:hypothetical protein